MDEVNLMQSVLNTLLGKSNDGKTSRIRVVNLSVYNQEVDSKELERAFESLTLNTIAQGAHLHVRRGDTTLKGFSIDSTIRLDSFEMENPSMHQY